MKTRYLFLLIICLTVLVPISCNKDSNKESTTAVQTTPYQAGQLLTYSLSVDGDTVMKLRDEVIDYGFAGFPVLMLVHKETLIHKGGWGSVFHPLYKEKLDSVLVLWARQFNLNNLTLQEKALVARHFLDFIVGHDIDVGLFVELVLWHRGQRLAPMLEVVSAAERTGKSPNDFLNKMLEENIPPETFLSQLKSGNQLLEFAAMMVFVHWVETGLKIMDIFLKNQAVADTATSYISYVCPSDTILDHYTGGTYFKSSNYHLSYDVGWWEAKCTYHVDGYYHAVTPACSGLYITHCNTVPTYCHVKGPGFIVSGNTSYSPPINTGDFDAPVPEMNGKVQVTYGDCCCFRKFSILNFKINAGTGFKQTTWDPGK